MRRLGRHSALYLDTNPLACSRLVGVPPPGNLWGSPVDIIDAPPKPWHTEVRPHTLSLRGRLCLIPSGHGTRRDSGGCRSLGIVER